MLQHLLRGNPIPITRGGVHSIVGLKGVCRFPQGNLDPRHSKQSLRVIGLVAISEYAVIKGKLELASRHVRCSSVGKESGIFGLTLDGLGVLLDGLDVFLLFKEFVASLLVGFAVEFDLRGIGWQGVSAIYSVCGRPGGLCWWLYSSSGRWHGGRRVNIHGRHGWALLLILLFLLLFPSCFGTSHETLKVGRGADNTVARKDSSNFLQGIPKKKKEEASEEKEGEGEIDGEERKKENPVPCRRRVGCISDGSETTTTTETTEEGSGWTNKRERNLIASRRGEEQSSTAQNSTTQQRTATVRMRGRKRSGREGTRANGNGSKKKKSGAKGPATKAAEEKEAFSGFSCWNPQEKRPDRRMF